MTILSNWRLYLRRSSPAVVTLGTLALIASVVAASLVTSPAGADHVVPEVWGDQEGETGNPDCDDINGGWNELKIDPPKDGEYKDTYGALGHILVAIEGLVSSDGESFDWSSNIGVDAVIVKGGPNANVYFYDPESLGDDGLFAPPDGQQKHEISHITFCYDVQVASNVCLIDDSVDGRIIVDFPSTWRLRAQDNRQDYWSQGPLKDGILIPAGTYDIILASHDNHSQKAFQPQPHEQWYLEGLTSGDPVVTVFSSSAIDDLPDDQDYVEQTVDYGVFLAQDVYQLVAHHAFPGGSNPNSVNPVCAAFDPFPVLTLKKNVTNDDGGTAGASEWTLTAAGDGGFSGAGTPTDETDVMAVLGPNEVKAGVAYALSELGPDGYSASGWVCDGGTQENNTIELALGNDVTCTITNDDIAPSLKLVKEVTNDDGGTGVAAEWTLSATWSSGEGDTTRDISEAGGTAGFVPVFANAVYELAEISATWTDGVEYDFGAFSCDDGIFDEGNQTIELAEGESATCTVTNDDIAVAPALEGCTPGFWKNHPNVWGPTGYDPGDPVDIVFTEASSYFDLDEDGFADTLLDALHYKGGRGAEGGARILLRAAVAALLNPAHPDIGYPWSETAVIDSVNAALAGGERTTMLALAEALDFDNNLGCPIDAHGNVLDGDDGSDSQGKKGGQGRGNHGQANQGQGNQGQGQYGGEGHHGEGNNGKGNPPDNPGGGPPGGSPRGKSVSNSGPP